MKKNENNNNKKNAHSVPSTQEHSVSSTHSDPSPGPILPPCSRDFSEMPPICQMPRCLPIFHTHFLFQHSTLRQFTFTFTFCYFCVKSHLKEPTKFSNHMERGRKVNMSLRHVKVSFGEEVLRILVPLRTF